MVNACLFDHSQIGRYALLSLFDCVEVSFVNLLAHEADMLTPIHDYIASKGARP